MQISGHDIRVEYVNNIFIGSETDRNEWQEWNNKLQGILEKIPPKAIELKPIIQFLVATIAPSKIFMIKSEELSASEDVRYIDLLIVISGSCAVPFTELEPILQIACLKDTSICCSLHNEGSVLESLRNGHLFYSLNFKPDNLVYDNKTVDYPKITEQALSDIKKSAKEKFNQAFTKAKDFFELATIFNQDYISDILGFLLHQAVELTYRAILRSLNGYDKKSHEIRLLKKQVRRVAANLNTVFPDDTEAEKRLLDILESAYLDARYSDTGPMSSEIISVLLEKIDRLQDLAKQIVESKLGTL